jgi:hypothetical protein
MQHPVEAILMKITRILALTSLTATMAAAGFGAAMTTGSNSSAASAGSGSSTIHENSGIFTTPSSVPASSPGENTAPRLDPGIQPDNFNTSPRELPPADTGGTGATGGSAGPSGTGSVLPSVPANDASVNGPGVPAADDVPARDSSHVLNGTSGSRPMDQSANPAADSNSTVR